jgi:hypothetical protein
MAAATDSSAGALSFRVGQPLFCQELFVQAYVLATVLAALLGQPIFVCVAVRQQEYGTPVRAALSCRSVSTFAFLFA